MNACFRLSWGMIWILLGVYSATIFVEYGKPTYIFPTFVELLCIGLVLYVMSKVKPQLSWMVKLISVFMALIILIQLQFIEKSGTFVTVLAVWNADSASFIHISVSAYFPIIIFVLLFAFSRLGFGHLNKKVYIISIIVLLSYCGFVYAKIKDSALFSEWRSPLLSAVQTINSYAEMKHKIDAMKVDGPEREGIFNSFKHDIIYNPENESGELLKSLPKQPNVVVFFVEGMSANIIDYYGGKYKDLTPNIDELAQSSLVFKNYYNHTAATFRGLRGQLTSTYQYIGGTEASKNGFDQISSEQVVLHSLTKLSTLPNILRDQGYRSYFFSPHYRGANLHAMLASMGFDRVFTRADNVEFNGANTEPLTDKALIDLLIKQTKNQKYPFFIGVYNFGTHLTIDSPDVKYKDGSSIVLNRFHNLDAQIGRYVNYLKSSGMDKNTIVIVTSDHASFPAPEFTSVIDTKHDYFIDKIPFIVYWKGVQHQEVDVKGRNSVNFAPTLLNLLKIPKVENYFMGCSMLDKDCQPVANISAYGESFFISDENDVYPERAIPTSLSDSFKNGKAWVWKGYKMTDNAQ